MPLMMENCSK